MTRHFSMANAAADRLERAQVSIDGRSAVSLHEGEPCVLRQTVTALLSGQRMEIEHPPDEAWILVLVGRMSLELVPAEHQTHPAVAGDLLQLPPVPLALVADEDSVLLLTVAKGERPGS
jgi:quercetin dioxygenase-like cupin family protein